MIQREISELRRHMTPERTNMTHIYGCYVNGEKQIISSYEQSLAVMEKNARPRAGYFDYQVPCGSGYVLEADGAYRPL